MTYEIHVKVIETLRSHYQSQFGALWSAGTLAESRMVGPAMCFKLRRAKFRRAILSKHFPAPASSKPFLSEFFMVVGDGFEPSKA